MGWVDHGPVEPRSGAPLAEARIAILGSGVTGTAVKRALTAHGVGSRVEILAPSGGDVVIPSGDAELAAWLSGFDVLVASPGVPPHDRVLVAAAAGQLPIWSEPELAWRLRVPNPATGEPAPWLAVTGTNGKTTTVEMLASILSAAGLTTRAVGNVGTPLIEAALDPTLDVLAVELSSFQLHFTHTMAAQASAMLNLADDHLDWHGTMENYGNDKGRIFEHAEVACVYNTADAMTERQVREADVAEGARAVGFTLGAPGPGMLGLIEDVLVDRAFHAPADALDRRTHAAELGTLADLAHLAPSGADDGPSRTSAIPPHVVANALAAAALARAHGVPAKAVRDGLRSYRPAGHRIEQVAVVDDVSYVNDSKATNAHAASAALAGFPAGSVVWIAGGLAKGSTFDGLVAGRADRLRAAVVIGVDPEPFTQPLARHAADVPVVVVDPGDTGSVMRRAVDAARSLAQPGDTVLLAPAGASQDQFRSYAQRGEAFADAVRELAGDA